MLEPTREQEQRALGLASFYDSVEVHRPVTEDGPVKVVCYNRHEPLPGRNVDDAHEGMHVIATFTLDCDGRKTP